MNADSAAPSAVPTTSTEKPLPQRLMSVDALRGFDMFWIIGADALVHALNRMNGGGFLKFIVDQLEHKDWRGFAFYDMIFPLFVFIVGVSTVFSLTRAIEKDGPRAAFKRVFQRFVLLYIFALLYSGGFSSEWPNIRLLGVLNRIALAYLFTGLLFCLLKPRGLVIACVSILLGYWAIMALVPIRDIQMEKTNLERLAVQTGESDPVKLFYNTTNYVTGKYEPGYNVAHHFDFQYLPGKRWDVYWDPEGIVSTLPAIATCLLGVFAGLLLQNTSVPDQKKVIYLASFGVGGVILGFLWGTQFPVIKKIWSSSYVLVAGGYSALLLAAFYQVIDIWKYQKWCIMFVWIGMNSITVYLARSFVDFRKLSARFAGGDVQNFLNGMAQGLGDLTLALVSLALAIILCRFLYQRKIFLRL